MRSSQVQGRVASCSNPQRLELQNTTIQVVGGNQTSALDTMPLAHRGHLTGIHRDLEGQRLCLHEQQLYEFDDFLGGWKLSEGTKHMRFSTLLAQGNGKLYGQVDSGLVDLSSQGMPHVALPADVKVFSVSTDKQVAVLSGDHDQVLQLINLEQDPPANTRSFTLKLNDGLAQPKSLGLSQDHLFISDSEGRLYSVRRDDLNREVVDLKPQPFVYPNGERLGGNKQVVGLLSGNEGQIEALISDRSGHVHSHSLNGDTLSLSNGWNLTDTLVLNNRRGLPTSLNPTPANTLELDLLGRIGLSEQQIKRWDTASQHWKDTGIQGVETLKRGSDGQAYLLQDGTVKKLNVSLKHNALAFGASHVLNQLPRSIDVAVGEKVDGLEGRTVLAFAMLNDKQFVVLDNQQRLTVHRKDGEPTNLGFAGSGSVGKITSLTFDEHHHLYALTDWGELFVMTKDNWQASDEITRSKAVWTFVASPSDIELTSIRTADNNRLSAAFRGIGDHSPIQFQDKIWLPQAAKLADQHPFDDLTKRLRGGEKVMRLPLTGFTMRANVNLLGRSAMESTIPVSTREFI